MSRIPTLPSPVSDRERIRDEAAATAQRASLMEAAGAAVMETTPAVWVREFLSSGFDPDPAWKLDQKTLDQMGDGLDPDLRERLGGAVSQDHAIEIAVQAQKQQARREALASRGWQGTMLSVGASIADPVFAAVALGTGGLGEVAAISKAGRIAGLIRGGMVAGLPFAAVEATRHLDDPNGGAMEVLTAGLSGFGFGAGAAGTQGLGRGMRFLGAGAGQAGGTITADAIAAAVGNDIGVDDVLWNAGGAFVMGGLFNSLHGTPKGDPLAAPDPVDIAARRMQRDAEYRAVQAAGTPITDKGKVYFKEQTPEAMAARSSEVTKPIVEDLAADGEVVAAVAKDFAPGEVTQAMGAASQNPHEFPSPPPKVAKEFGDLDLSNANDSTASMGKARFDMPGMVSQSEVESFRLASNVLGPDPLPKTDGSPSVYTAPEWVNDGHAADQAKMFTANDALYGEFVRTQKASNKKPLTREAWAEEVGKAVRRAPGAHTSDPTVNAAADNLRAMSRDLYGIAARHGVKGFDKFDARDTYFTRIANRDTIDAAIATHGEEAVRLMVARAIVAGSEGIDAEKANLLAKAWLKNIGKVYDGSDVARGRIFAEDQSETLAAVLKEAVDGITDAQVEDVLFAVKPRDPAGGTISRARRRIDMDETFAQDMGNGVRLGIEDLLENNAEVIGGLYSRQIRGAAAMAEVFRVMKRSEDEAIDTLPQLMKRLETDAKDFGHANPDGSLNKQVKSDLAKIETMAKITAGIPLAETTDVHRALRVIRNGNFFRTMSGVGTGLQNAAEVVHAMSETGLKATINSIPELGKVFSRARNGELSTPFLREIEQLVGLGTERINRRSMPRLGNDDGAQVSIGKAEQVSAKFARLAGDVSLVAPGQTLVQRWTARMIGNRWAEMAISGKLPSADRLAGMGLTESMAKRIAGEIKKHGVTEKGLIGVELTRSNMDRWTDIEAASHFRIAISKQARRLILVNNQAAYAKWMTTEAGKVVSQLRTFSFGAWTNKFLYEVRMRDAQAFINVGVTTAAAGLVYVGRTYLDSVGKPDRKQFLKDRLSTGSIAKAAFSRAAWSSMIPMAVDTLVGDIGQRKPVFSFARTTGLEGGALFGNPTLDWANKATKSIGALQAPVFGDYEFSKQDVRNLRDALWVPNVLGLRNVIDQLSRRLPDRSQGN